MNDEMLCFMRMIKSSLFIQLHPELSRACTVLTICLNESFSINNDQYTLNRLSWLS